MSQPTESRAAESATVLWMLAVMNTLFCQTGAIISQWYVHANPNSPRAAALGATLALAAMVVGAIVLALTPVVLKVRREPPPRIVTMIAVVIGAAPFISLLVANLSR
jgi:membrane protein YdbS with pleckstrin-like domain